MAIDGVAPRAKMNQQRSRRFRSAKDLAEATKDKRIVPADGANVDNVDPYSGAFDSNCITPGTEFLLRISECIQYFIRKKIKEDPLWKNLSVIFSGPEVPGCDLALVVRFTSFSQLSSAPAPLTFRIMPMLFFSSLRHTTGRESTRCVNQVEI
jgi:5'-3' exonuclease